MGLQTWPPSKPPLPSMACLDVETPSICRGKFKSVLQLCLQQRRSREQLVEQGIMPPLKSPAAFHEQIRNLERARTGNFLKHKLCSRPERSELVRMHILQETQAEPSLQATQMKLKRARLADDLNEKIAKRPGPLELVEKKILPVDSVIEELIDGNEADCSQTLPASDVYSFDEDSGDAVSPLQSNSQPSPRSHASPSESEGAEATSVLKAPTQHSVLSPKATTDVVNTKQQSNQQPRLSNTNSPSGPVLVKQSLARLPADKTRGKKSKEPRPRVKKLKYHQYIPPDQKQEHNEVQMDSSYARLLQQQQQFLQLQILSQQQQYSYQTSRPALIQYDSSTKFRSTNEAQTSCSAVVLKGNRQTAPAQLLPTTTNHRPEHLPANLDEMKVSELKMELKLRSLPVSGTKTDLIERLKLFHESLNIQSAVATETTAAKAASQSENVKSPPPVSVIASKVSNLGINDNNMSPNFNTCISPQQGTTQEESPTQKSSTEKDSEKDKRLHEKERQIKELMRKLEQEQKLVEELKMQLEVEKRSQQGDCPLQLSPLVPLQIKKESRTPSSCSVSCGSPSLLVKQEESVDQNRMSSTNPFIICHQTAAQPDGLQTVQSRAQVLLPPTQPAPVELHGAASSTAPGHIQTSGQMPQKTQVSAALQQQCSTQTKQLKNKTQFTNQVRKTKDPPRYEDAVKQTRSMLAAVQIPTAASQHMDDLFDVLIESGEISPFIRQEPPGLDKPLPVTASVTTLPINTVLSRPPPLVQVAQLPGSTLNSSATLTGLTSNTQLENLLDNTLDAKTQKLKLTEELQSPMEELLIESTPPSGPNLDNSNIDNMDWLDLTLSAPAEGVNPLDMSISVGVFSPDFLDSHELQMNWD
ncbi:MKL/myocardin-like protein 2 isoform X1 [Oryzias latipes]|uniref:Myocardin related transcription factor Bb n=1 Tax=Oryzias latipes TaxID=8090 RepID=H2LK74_ORYLA|nr:MKL/myocardin-like protein 2 isoform X1 [Oryzias latipes]